MKVDELPLEILIDIFSYLLTFKKISLVNRRFYEVACIVNDKNISLTLDTNFFETAENRPLLQSIEGSSRKIKNVKIHLWKLTKVNKRSIISVLMKFPETITHLEIGGYSTDGSEMMAYFLEILSLVPNAEYLTISELYVSPADRYQPETSNNEDLNLKHLKKLNFFLCNEVFQVVFNRLPAGVLREFSWRGYNLLSLETLFLRQTNIKKLSLVEFYSGIHLPAHILDNMELELLKIRNIRIEAEALSRQIKLKSLSTDKHHVVMKVVANYLTELEELEWELPLKRPTGIISELIQLDYSRIATLKISNFHGVTVHQIKVLAKSAAKLKVLKFTNYLDKDTITEILCNFNFVESLTLANKDNVGSYETYLNQNDSVNANLTELNFQLEYNTLVLRKMIADFQNLKKLTIYSETSDLTSSDFQLILNGFTKLESLDLAGFVLLTIEDFKYLRDHRKRLQFLQVWSMDNDLVNYHLENVEAMFEVVKYSPTFRLILKM